MNKKDFFKYLLWTLLLGLLFLTLFSGLAIKTKTISYAEFLERVEKKEVESIEINLDKNEFIFTDNNENTYITENPKYDNFKKDMLEKGIEVKEMKSFNFSVLISLFINVGFFILIFYSLKSFSKMAMNEKGIKPKTVELKNKVTFKDVAGLSEVKKDLLLLVDFLKNPKIYKEAGAKLPKGMILYGPPGTGKTLLARAIAGEANVPFFSVNGSDFIEKYVGVGASRVRELFETAKKSAPCILFIDELDAIGSSRGNFGGTSEHRQTMNALLSEMDGFVGDTGVLVIGATNRLEDLDNALIRPGRFDSHIAVPIPETATERLTIIKMYAEGKKFAEDVDFDNLAKETLGFSPADIESLLNDSALISVQKEKKFIDRECLDSAIYKKLLKGHQKESKERDKEELELVAWHEAGHAIIGLYFGEDIPKVTIVPSTSGAGGVTFFNQKKLGLYSLEELEQQVMINYGGRCAEYLLRNDEKKVTTGASSDIKQATAIIHEIITSYGMSKEYGLLNLNDLNIENKVILKLASQKANELELKTKEILNNNFNKLKLIAETLIEKETISGEELLNLYNFQ